MTKLVEYSPSDPDFARAWRSLQAIMSQGIRWEDQIAPLVSFLYDSTASSHAVKLVGGSAPIAVLCLDAQPETADGTHVSGGEVAWSWDAGVLTITSVGTLSGTYTVRLGIVR